MPPSSRFSSGTQSLTVPASKSLRPCTDSLSSAQSGMQPFPSYRAPIKERPRILFQSYSWKEGLTPRLCGCPCVPGFLLAPALTWTPVAAASSRCTTASSCCTLREARSFHQGWGRGGAGRASGFSQSEAEEKKRMEGVGCLVRARLGVGRWLTVTEGVPSVMWPTGLLSEKTVWDPRNQDGAASFSYPERLLCF